MRLRDVIAADPALPPVALHDVACQCGRTLQDIRAKRAALPEVHFADPDSCTALCPITRDGLLTFIYRAQRNSAGLGAPRRLAS